MTIKVNSDSISSPPKKMVKREIMIIPNRNRATMVLRKLFFCHSVAPSVKVTMVLTVQETSMEALYAPFQKERTPCSGGPGLKASLRMVEETISEAYCATATAAKKRIG